MLTGVSFMLAAIAAFARSLKQIRQALAVARSREISVSDANKLLGSNALVCVRGKVTAASLRPGTILTEGIPRFLDSFTEHSPQQPAGARLLSSSYFPDKKGVVIEETEKFLYQEVVSPLRRLVSCRLLDMLPQPTLYLWPLHPTTRLAFEYRDSWQQRRKELRTSHRDVPFGLQTVDPLRGTSGGEVLLVERGTGLRAALANSAGDILMSPMQTVYRHMDALPWDLSDVLADVAQQDLDGRRRAVGMLREERILPVGKVLTVVGRIRSLTQYGVTQELGARRGGGAHRASRLLGSILAVNIITPLTKQELVLHFAVRGIWNLAWSTGLGVVALGMLRRQRERMLYVLRWGHLPHESILPIHELEADNPLDNNNSDEGEYEPMVEAGVDGAGAEGEAGDGAQEEVQGNLLEELIEAAAGVAVLCVCNGAGGWCLRRAGTVHAACDAHVRLCKRAGQLTEDVQSADGRSGGN
eukprot:CAMPEP_0114235474 /NCGR_PEP_ID=MMETSP0058-20121206/6272_1 /TAXON_ID=36894 /ORGANISM="Pyramimonas parkeae, CCMP726" /LENGTH=470 /DNA_ID=CAMNT_0001347243 /DNA_START=76 /DNA_END=1492 /DNA_ORIENTATION=+